MYVACRRDRERSREYDLIKTLEATRTSTATQLKVKRLELNEHLEAKYTGCIVRYARKSRPLARLEWWKSNTGMIHSSIFGEPTS